jgi:hypothetical protein
VRSNLAVGRRRIQPRWPDALERERQSRWAGQHRQCRRPSGPALGRELVVTTVEYPA